MTTRVIAYPAPWRIATATLTATSHGAPLLLATMLLFLDDWLGTQLRLTNPLRLLRAFVALCVIPEVSARVLQRLFAAEATFEPGALVLQGRRRRIEILYAAMECALPWRIPLPAGGVSIRLKSGKLLRYALQVSDPLAFVDALVGAGAAGSIRRHSEPHAAIYARSKVAQSWRHLLLKFAVFALVPALPLFRLHQWIAYGGTFGEYYVHGLEAYLLGLGLYWAAATVYLVLYASVLRAVAEPIVWLAARVAPSETSRVRQIVEAVTRLLYYGGVLLFLLRIYLAS